MERAKVAGVSGVSECQLHLSQACATLPLTPIEIVLNHALSFIAN